MVAAAGVAVSAVGTAANIAGSKGGKSNGAPSQSGFSALPKSVQDAWLNTYLPKAMTASQLPYQSVPMQRATNPANDPFASQALWDLQRYSDAKGGMFSPMMGGAARSAPTPAVAPNTSSAIGGDPRAQYLANAYLSALTSNQSMSPVYQMLSQKIGNNPSQLSTMGNTLSQQNYNPSMGSGGVNVNAILAALGR